MLTLPVGRLAEVVGGELVWGPEDTVANGVAIDSRAVQPGAVFIALRGERVDGHDFIADAIAAGARALLVTRETDSLIPVVREAGRADLAVVRVADPVKAIGDLAAYHRGRLTCPVVGITGSTGKTTTKDLLGSVLGRSLRVVVTSGNMNNELGVPLTIMRAGVETQAVVLEMAMRGRGQIAMLCSMTRPTHGLVTNVGETHMELLGSPEAIADAKGELVSAIPADGTVFLNADDSWSARMRSISGARVVTYGLGDGADVRACDVTVDTAGHPSFRIEFARGTIEATLAVPGRHNAYNAAAAAAVALELGVGPDEIAAGLSDAALSPMRMEAFSTAGGITIINDAYNASPSSMRAAVSALMDISVPGRRIAVLGDMAELGSLTELAHFKLGEEVGRAGLDVLVTVGEKASRIADGARAEGLGDESMHRFADVQEAAGFLVELVMPHDAVLVKASRVIGLEHVVEMLMGPSCST